MEWTTIDRWINTNLAAIGTIVSIVSFLPIIWTCWEVTIGRKRRHNRWHWQARQAAGERPGILIVDLLDKGDITNDVEHYRKNSEQLKEVSEDRVFKIGRRKDLAPDDMPSIAQDLRRITGEIIEAGVDTLHLFYAGPVAPLALVGAEFANVRRVLLYQRNRTTGSYENWGPLRHHFL